MRWSNLFLACSLFVSAAHAEINVVKDASVTQGIQYSKVLTKVLTTESRPQIVEKYICETATETIHDLGNTVVKIYRNKPICRNKLVDETITVIVGYDITYEFKGKIISAKLNYDPGEYVQIYTGE